MITTLTHEHPPYHPRNPEPLVTLYDFVKLGFLFFGFPTNAFGSIDVTHRCNLRCNHCYFFEQDHDRNGDLSVAQWIDKLKALRRQGVHKFPLLQCTWVGGEPLLRPDLIEEGKKLFRFNTIVTNGTIPLPSWPDVNFYISIDGTREVHESLRNGKGIYAKMKSNANRPDLTVIGAYCITRDNYHVIEETILEWRDILSHMVFDFYTPIAGLDDNLWCDFELRDQIIDKLLALKKIYGPFFITPARTYRLMKSTWAAMVTKNCLFARKSFAFAPDGKPKQPCMLGPKADCNRCGCVVPYYMESLVNKRFIFQDLKGYVLNQI